MRILLTMGIAFSIGLLLVGTSHTPGASTPTGIQAGRQDPDLQDGQEAVKETARKVFMRGKLLSNQKIVEGLATSNYELIADGAASVNLLVKGQHWFVVDTPEYKRFSAEMELAATQLYEAAKAKNMDGAALRYFDLTLNCLDCHRYVEKRRY